MPSTLDGRTALVTGSTSGIGRATATALAERGAHVIVSGRDTARGEQAVAEIRAAGGKADFVRADLSDAGAARTLGQEALAITGRIDILVNNAGVFPFETTEASVETSVDQVFATNVKAPLFLFAELVPHMVARGSGSVVNISSTISQKGLPGATAYAASKAAVDQLTRVWAVEYAGTGVRINTVSPGPTKTEGFTDTLPEAEDDFAALTPLKRMGRPDEVAELVAFTVSDEASYVHGAWLAVDGGVSAT